MAIPAEFRVLRSIGLGATSEVFEAVKTDSAEPFALKVFSPLILSDADAVQRLRGEIDALERLRHANIVALRTIHAQPDFFALELELIRGTDLRAWLAAYDSSLYEPKMWLLAQVARGLGAAHENGVLHRDLKPENVLVSVDGCVKLTDFGLSRSISRLTLTRMGLLVGSLGYMAPECVNGLRASERSDLFSFGVIAYELLAGRPPFEAETPQALIKKITDGNFEPLRSVAPMLPESVAHVIDRCLSLDPALRPESSWSVEAVLMNHLLSTGMLPYCRALVGGETRAAALTEALSVKHERLATRVDEILAAGAAPAELRRQLMPTLNELKRVFPDDPLIARSIAAMTGVAPSEPNTIARARRPMMIAAAIGAIILFLLPLWQSHVFAPAEQAAAVSQQVPLSAGTAAAARAAPGAVAERAAANAAPSAVTPRAASPADPAVAGPALAVASTDVPPADPRLATGVVPAAKKKVVTAKASPENDATAAAKKPIVKREALPQVKALGQLVFEADPDVDIYVDGKLVSPTAWSAYETPIGERKIRLVKAGFDPIDNTVEVKEGQKTVVRARR